MFAYFTAMFMALVGIYILVGRTNLIKKVIGLSVFTNSVHLFLISLGYRDGGIAPIITSLGLDYALLASDPVVQAMVLTSIVISFSVTALALTLIVQVHRRFNTMDSKELRNLKG